MEQKRFYQHCPECRVRLRLDHKPRVKEGFVWNTDGQKIAVNHFYAPCPECGKQWCLDIGKNLLWNWT